MTSHPMPYPGFNPEIPGCQQKQQPYSVQQSQFTNPAYSSSTGQHPVTSQFAPPPGGQPSNYGAYEAPPMIAMPVHLSIVDSSAIKDKDLPGFIKFTDKAIRASFIRKYCLMIMLQLLLSLSVICLFRFYFLRDVIGWNFIIHYSIYVVFLVIYIVMACFSGLRRKCPCNGIMMLIFALSLGLMLGAISSWYNTQAVLFAVGISAGVCFGVFVFSFHNKFDFTSCGGILFVLVWVFFLFGILCIFTYNTIMTSVYALCGALLFTLCLASHVQILMRGEIHEISPEEYYFASIQIYFDIVCIFIFMLIVLCSGRSLLSRMCKGKEESLN